MRHPGSLHQGISKLGRYGATCLILLAGLAVGAAALAEDSAQRASSGPGVATGPNPDQGLPIEGWMVYPSFTAGGVFTSNVHNSVSNKQSALGIDLSPRFDATLDNGIHRTTVYGAIDAQIYPGAYGGGSSYPGQLSGAASSTSANSIQGRAGVAEVYAPFEDLTANAILDYTRLLGVFGSGLGVSAGAVAGAPSFYVANATAPTGLGPQYSNQLTGQLSVQKNITDRTFVTVTGGAQGLFYDTSSSPAAAGSFAAQSLSTQQNGVNYTASARVGYWAAPTIYVFAEPGLSFRRYQYSQSNTSGYSAVGGIGSDQIGFFRGEIYGGFQSQSSAYGQTGAISSPAFGARLLYYPTPYLTISGTAAETLGSTLPSVATAGGGGSTVSGAKSIQATLQASYAFSPVWQAWAQGGYGRTTYTSSSAVSAAWTVGAGISYTFWRNLALTLSDQFNLISNTNVVGSGLGNYSQNILMAGVTYRY